MITLRGRARRLVARSWALSRFYYRLHGLPLAGWPGEPVWYFAYGANMNDRAFRERRRMRPIEQRIGRIRGYRLRFNLDGRPRGRSAPANLCPDPEAEVWGVLYKVTRRDLLRLDSTEGVPGRGYRPQWIAAEDDDGHSVSAVAYVARGKATDGNPSLRYLTLLREGARANGLPGQWLQFFDSVEHAEATTRKEH
jgi:cation transport regulator ChaC